MKYLSRFKARCVATVWCSCFKLQADDQTDAPTQARSSMSIEWRRMSPSTPTPTPHFPQCHLFGVPKSLASLTVRNIRKRGWHKNEESDQKICKEKNSWSDATWKRRLSRCLFWSTWKLLRLWETRLSLFISRARSLEFSGKTIRLDKNENSRYLELSDASQSETPVLPRGLRSRMLSVGHVIEVYSPSFFQDLFQSKSPSDF